METVLISASPAYQKLLADAIGELTPISRTYTSFAELSTDFNPDLVLYAPTKDGEDIPENMNIIGFVPKDLSLADTQKQSCLMVFNAPVRLGVVKQALYSYITQRRQRDQLKPVVMGRFELDPKTNQMMDFKTKVSYRLTEKEQDILLYLSSQNGAPVTRQDLLDHVWQYAKGVETHTLETHIYRLRQKIEQDPTRPQFLMTNEAGYFLNI